MALIEKTHADVVEAGFEPPRRPWYRRGKVIGAAATAGAVLLGGGLWLKSQFSHDTEPQAGRGDAPAAGAFMSPRPIPTQYAETQISASPSPEAQPSQAPQVQDGAYLCGTLGKFATALAKAMETKVVDPQCTHPGRGIEAEYSFMIDDQAVVASVINLTQAEPAINVGGTWVGYQRMPDYRAHGATSLTIKGQAAGCMPTNGQVGLESGADPNRIARFEVIDPLGQVGSGAQQCDGMGPALRLLQVQFDK